MDIRSAPAEKHFPSGREQARRDGGEGGGRESRLAGNPFFRDARANKRGGMSAPAGAATVARCGGASAVFR